MFNVPPVVIATVAVLVLVHALRMFVLTDAQDEQFLLTFAFIPARYGTDPRRLRARSRAASAPICGPSSATPSSTPICCISALNLAWLLPFGTALARRFGAWRYVAFMLVTAAAGAFAHLVSHPGAMVPMIGASAAISGAMAAAMRFVFQQGGPLGVFRAADDAMPIACRPRRCWRRFAIRGSCCSSRSGSGSTRCSASAPCRSAEAGPGNRLAGPYRRLFRRLAAVHRVRSGRAARRTRYRGQRLTRASIARALAQTAWHGHALPKMRMRGRRSEPRRAALPTDSGHQTISPVAFDAVGSPAAG